jgi:hypothetical protein
MSCGAGGVARVESAGGPVSRLAVQEGRPYRCVAGSRFDRREWAMGFDRARFDAANVRAAFGPRRLHLAALDAVLCTRRELACGVVQRDGVPA